MELREQSQRVGLEIAQDGEAVSSRLALLDLDRVHDVPGAYQP